MTTVMAPVPFSGTEAEAAANRESHSFGWEGRCFFCDCKPWHLSASYPCGTEPDRAEMPEVEYAVRTGGFGAVFNEGGTA
jgi:hypothetical protein